VPGWSVGAGGLRGKIGPGGKPFDLGARATLFRDLHPRPPHHPYPAPAIEAPRDGALYLGFKAFAPGANTGSLEVIVRPAVRVGK